MMEMIGKKSFAKSSNLYVSPLVTITRLSGMFTFNLAAIKNYNLEKYSYILLWKNPEEEDELYFSPTDNKEEGFKITRYKAGDSENTFLKFCSKHVAEYIANMYKFSGKDERMIFYLNKETTLSKEGFPMFSILKKTT